MNLSDGIQQVYNEVWNSGWNFDLLGALVHSIDQGAPNWVRRYSPIHIRQFFNIWSKKSMDEILTANWAIPYPDNIITKDLTGLPTIGEHIQGVRQLYEGTVEQTRRFIVHIVNTIGNL
jgi:hypothetical protein